MAEYRNKNDLLKAFQELADEFAERWKEHRIDALIHELGDLAEDTARSDFWDNADRAREISMRKSEMERRAEPWRQLEQELKDFPDLVELTVEEFKEDQKGAIESLAGDLRTLQERFEELLLAEALAGPDDGRDAIVTISSGAGGTESQDWAEMLLRMYTRWFESRGFRSETLDLQEGEEAGVKSASLMVRGDHAFGYLKSENGVHRLVRISPFDSQKRRHTSFAAVHVVPDIEDSIDVAIEEKDLRVDTYRASGAGGQHINKTDSAIRITHIPTGIVVQCQNERSQHKNRSTAMKMLKARLYELERQKIQADIESRSGEKSDVSWGNQIRSYVFHPYKMVKDLRTQHETGDVEGVMNGDLDDFVKAYLKSSASGKALKAVQEKDV